MTRAWAAIVDVPSSERPDLDRIEPGDPANSYLFRKVSGEGDISGSPMPLGSQPLSSEQIELLRAWILAGAPDN